MERWRFPTVGNGGISQNKFERNLQTWRIRYLWNDLRMKHCLRCKSHAADPMDFIFRDNLWKEGTERPSSCKAPIESDLLSCHDLRCAKERIRILAGRTGALQRSVTNRNHFTAVRVANKAMPVSRHYQTTTRFASAGGMGLSLFSVRIK